MRAAASPLVLLGLLVLAGCATPEAAPADPWPAGPLLPDGTPAPLVLELADCAEQVGIFPADPSYAAPYLPEGFTAASFEDTPYISVVLVAYSCRMENATINEANVGIVVTPPPALANATARFHLVPITSYTDNADLATLYHAWGANATHALAEVTVAVPTPDNPLVRAGTVTASGPFGAFTMNTAAPVAGGAPETSGSARLFIVDAARNVTAAMDWAWTASAMATQMGAATFDSAEAGGPADIPAAAPGVAFHVWGAYGLRVSYVLLATL